jgi:acetyltransferase-like isoleucine patch superfamily enzyme/acyl carrier protein
VKTENLGNEPPEARSAGPDRPDRGRQPLDEREFIRQRLHGGQQGVIRRYASLVLAHPTALGLIRYELVNLFSGFPGALGLVLRKVLFRSLLGSVGRGVIFGRNITLRHADNLHVGDRVVLDDYCLLDARGAGERGIRLGEGVLVHRNASIQAKVGHISIGRNSSVGAFSQIVSQGSIDIGENVSIAGGVGIAGGRYQVEIDEDGPDAKKRFTAGPIRIGANVRLGRGAIVLDGVTIGRGAIVAPGSVVMNDVAADTVVIGCPARPLRRRDSSGPTADAMFPAESHPAARVPDQAAGRREAVKALIRRYVEETHFAEFGPGELSDDDSLFDHGIIDSAGVVALVTMLESELGVRFEEADLDPDKLATVNGLADLALARISAAVPGSGNTTT